MGKDTKHMNTPDAPTPTATAAKRPKRTTKSPHFRHVKRHDFFQLAWVHPYGCLPEGNRWLEQQIIDNNNNNNNNTTADDRKTNTAKSAQQLLNDTAWIHVLSFCDAPELAGLVQVSRYFYVVAHQPELWRDLVLRRIHNNQPPQQLPSSSSPHNSTTILQHMEPSWKDTYVSTFVPTAYQRPHIPQRVPGVYSDDLYRLHATRAFGIPQAWLQQEHPSINNNPFPVIPRDILTPYQFWNEYESTNHPVLVQGAAKSWPAYQKWNNPQYLQTQCTSSSAGGGDTQAFRATSGVAPLPASFTFAAYHQYATTATASTSTAYLEEAPLYLFDRTALEPNTPLWYDVFGTEDHVSDTNNNSNNTNAIHQYWPTPTHDLFAYLGPRERPDHTWWIVGPQRSGSVFHIDPNATHAWNATIVGRKRWIFYPPGVTPPGVHPSADGDSVALPLSVGEWLLTFWDEHCARRDDVATPLNQRPLEITAHPGDIVFVPHGWWHMVINLDAGMNIAVTHNYVSQSNLSNVLRFLSEKRDQISGCRDRPHEAIPPDRLYEAFTTVLRQRHPDWLTEALAAPDWTCPTWNSPNSTTTTAVNATMKNEKESSTGNASPTTTTVGTTSTMTTTATHYGVSIMSKAKEPSQANSDKDNNVGTTFSSNDGGFTFSFL